MKKILVLICAILCLCLLTACNELPQVESYKLNENGNLIATFDDGTTQDLGTLEDTIASGVNKIEINNENFYVINGIITDIKAKIPVSYTLNADGKLIVTYNDETTEDLGNFENDAINVIDTIAISDDGYYVLNGVKTNIVATEVFEVSFDTGYYAMLPKKNVKDGYKVELPELTRTGYTLDGWYCNGEKWSFNSDIVKSNMTLNAVWVAKDYNVSFDTGITQAESDVVITYDSAYTLPILSRAGYTFDGWEYQGRLVTNKKWNIDTDCKLKASWTLNKYEVTLNANGGTVSADKVLVEYGKAFTLPVASNEYGAFIGWFYGEQQITDENGNSLTDWTHTENLEFTTSWIIELSTADDLQQLYKFPNAYFELKNTIDISANEWTPVGTSAEPFTGTIDGKGYSIKGLTIKTASDEISDYGFIGCANKCTVKNLNFENVEIELTLLKNADFGTIICNSNVITQDISKTRSLIYNCKTSGTINITSSSMYGNYVAGIGGTYIDVKDSVNEISITATSSLVSGILTQYGSVEGCSNYGVINAYIGAGISYGANISLCKNHGAVTATTYASGIIHEGKNITNCKNDAIITGTYASGIGYAENINNSSNTGDIYGNVLAAGISCSNFYDGIIVIANCYNIGEITSSEGNAAGIVSAKKLSQVTNCYNAGTINGKTSSGISCGCSYIIGCINFADVNGVDSYIISNTKNSIYPNIIVGDITLTYYWNEASANAYQGESTTEKFAKAFYTDQMFWSDSVWTFFEDKLPELK